MIWNILMALTSNFFVTVYINTLYIYYIFITSYIFNSLLYQVVKLPDPTIFTITSPSQETSYFYKLKNLFAINSKIP